MTVVEKALNTSSARAKISPFPFQSRVGVDEIEAKQKENWFGSLVEFDECE